MVRKRVYSAEELRERKRAADAGQMRNLGAVAEAFGAFRPASEVFTRVRAVPTCFVQFDHGVRVGGLPAERIALVHGPSGEGKTLFTLGLARSFLAAGHPVYFVDAERTLEKGFIDLVIGEHVRSPLFRGARPDTYEATRVAVRKFCNIVAELRRKGSIRPDACGLVIVDSIRKLVPADQWKRLLELAHDAAKDEKARDRLSQHKAQMNAAWCDELIPLLEQTGCTMVIIAREIEDPDAPPPRAMPGRPAPPKRKKTLGGSAMYYDASLDLEVTRACFVEKKSEKDGERGSVYGERHRVTIKKSKVSGREDKVTVCYFHSSNGKLLPEGLDAGRDLVELGLREGIIRAASKKKPKPGPMGLPPRRQTSGWMQWNGRKWNGEHAAAVALHKDPVLRAELEAAVREKFRRANPIEVTADGEVIEG